MTTTRAIYLFLLVWSLLSFSSSALSLTVPSHWRLNGRGQPRLCWVVETTVKGLTRIGFGSFPAVVEVSAVSNRALLQGKLSQLSLQVKHSRSKLIPVEEFLLQGSHLELGWTPLIVTTLPWILLLTRPPLFSLLSCWYLWSMVKKYRNASAAKQTPSTHLDYSLTWNNSNLSQSSLWKHAAQRLLRSLLSNSVLPMAAAAGDSISDNNNNSQPPESTKGDLVVVPPSSSSSNNRLSTLLSATQFQLRGDPFFQAQGWLELPSQAILPHQQGTLEFVLRTKPHLGHASKIEFDSPQIQLDVRAVPLTVPKQLLPETVWVPIGPGVAVEIQHGRITVDRLGISNAACRIDGRIKLGESSTSTDKNTSSSSSMVGQKQP